MINLRRLLFIFPVLMLMSCGNDDESPSNLIDVGPFKIDIPEGWQSVTAQGYDSYVASFLTSAGETISFDLGMYSSSLNVDNSTHDINFKTIDNKNAKIVVPKTSGQGTTGVFFESIDGNGSRFQMSGSNLSVTTQMQFLAAIETLKFR